MPWEKEHCLNWICFDLGVKRIEEHVIGAKPFGGVDSRYKERVFWALVDVDVQNLHVKYFYQKDAMLIDDHLHHAASNHAARPFNSLIIYKLFLPDYFNNI